MICYHIGLEGHGDLLRNPWFGCELRREQQTSDVKMLPAKDMREVEVLTETALPVSYDDRERISAAGRAWQIGPNACWSLLEAATADVQPAPVYTLLVDLFVRTGDMAEAFVKLRQAKSNFCYVGFCETQDEETYVQAYLRDALAELYETGAPMPNGEKAEQCMSQDLMEPMPAHPRMNVLATCIKIKLLSVSE